VRDAGAGVRPAVRHFHRSLRSAGSIEGELHARPDREAPNYSTRAYRGARRWPAHRMSTNRTTYVQADPKFRRRIETRRALCDEKQRIAPFAIAMRRLDGIDADKVCCNAKRRVLKLRLGACLKAARLRDILATKSAYSGSRPAREITHLFRYATQASDTATF
jgi:hypothetical protein